MKPANAMDCRVLTCSFWLFLFLGCAGGGRLPQTELDTRLVRAAQAGDIELIKACLRMGADLNGRDAEGWTPYLAAACNGRLRAMNLLKSMGAKTIVEVQETALPDLQR